jgi:hypothetical protein
MIKAKSWKAHVLFKTLTSGITLTGGTIAGLNALSPKETT